MACGWQRTKRSQAGLRGARRRDEPPLTTAGPARRAEGYAGDAREGRTRPQLRGGRPTGAFCRYS